MTKRSRLVEWEDPSRFADALGKLSGLEFIRAFLSGRLPAPPIAEEGVSSGEAPAPADDNPQLAELQDKVASAFEERGVATIRASIGGEPTDDTEFQILR